MVTREPSFPTRGSASYRKPTLKRVSKSKWVPAYAGMTPCVTCAGMTRCVTFAGMTLRVTCAGMTMLAFCHNAAAQTYPTRPIRLVVAQSVGGNADFVSRNYAQRLAERLS